MGPSAVKRLNRCGIYTIGDLAQTERRVIVGIFGARGDTLWNYANGREADPVTKQATRDNTYGNSVTLPRDLAKPEEAGRHPAGPLRFGGAAAAQRRQDRPGGDGAAGGQRLPPHPATSGRCPTPTNSTDRLYEVALQLMRQMWPARPVRLVGISAEKTGTDNFEQLDLFTDTTRRQKQEALDRTADALRRKFGGAVVTRAKLLTPETRGTGGPLRRQGAGQGKKEIRQPLLSCHRPKAAGLPKGRWLRTRRNRMSGKVILLTVTSFCAALERTPKKLVNLHKNKAKTME